MKCSLLRSLSLVAVVAACASEVPNAATRESPQDQEPAHVLGSGPTEESVDCRNQVTGWDLRICAALDSRRANQLLDGMLGKMHFKDDSTRAELFAKAQSRWLAYRAAHCDRMGMEYEGGSLQPFIESDCFAELTWSRIEELKQEVCIRFPEVAACKASRDLGYSPSRP